MINIINALMKSNDYIESVSELSVEILEKIILFAIDRYYYTSKPVFNDEYYDILIDFLRLKNPKSVILKEIGSPVISKNKIKLDYWLGSMNKIKSHETRQLNNWMTKYKGPYNISDKLDGISALLVYNNNKIILCTRGTATEGINITNLIKYLKLPNYSDILEYCNKKNIHGKKNLIAFRGELIIKSDVFNTKWQSIFKTSRNTVSGLINSKKINPKLALDTDLILYEIIDPYYDINTQFKIMIDMKFNTVYNQTVQELSFNYLSNYLITRISQSIYQIDGIIISNNIFNERNKKGNPEYAFAYKDNLNNQIITTTVIDIEWNISKDGYIIPTVIIDPVIINGVEIKRVSGHNAKNIVDNKIGKNAIIKIIRSCDVIPKIIEVIKPGEIILPINIEWKWNDTKVDIQIINTTNKEVANHLLIKNIYHFFSTLDTKYLGKQNIIKLIDNGLNSILKIITCKKTDLLNIEGIKEKSALNIINAIKEALYNVPLYKLMAASNKLGHGIGQEKIKLILEQYPNLLIDLKNWTKKEFIDKIIEIKGWDIKTATLLVSNMKKFINFYEEIKDYISIDQIKNNIENLSLLNIYITFSGFRDNEFKCLIISKGGQVNTTITNKTNYLIVKSHNQNTDKTEKAHQLNIPILTKEEFLIKFYNYFN